MANDDKLVTFEMAKAMNDDLAGKIPQNIKDGSGVQSTIEGNVGVNRADGACCHAEGSSTKAAGYYTHAEGLSTITRDVASHAEGQSTSATGNFAHAEGDNTTASGQASHSEGSYTVANHLAQHVFGQYNIADTSEAHYTGRGNYVEIVGNGTRNTRSNARTLDWSGNETLQGDLTVNAGSQNEVTVGTAINNLNAAAASIDDLKSAIEQTDYDISPYTGRFVVIAVHNNAYIKDTDGTLASYVNWVASDFIPCTPGTVIHIKSRNGKYNAFYTDKNESSFLQALNYGDTVVPQTAKYFRVSTQKSVYDQYGFDITTDQTGFDIALTGTDDTISSAAKWAVYSNDMDNLKVNKIYQIMYNQGIAHLPDSGYFGTVVTFEYNANAGSNTTVQLAFARYGKTYRRMKWGSAWGDWNEFSFVGDGKSVQSLGITLGSASAWGTYNSDADNLPVNSIVAVGYRTGIANLPGDVACIIVTNSVTADSGSEFVAQYAFAPIENAFYFRAKWSTWRAWQKIAENNFVAGSGVAITNANGWAAFDNDFNNLTVNKIYQILYTTEIANSPYEGFTGSLISFDYSPTAASKTNVQMAFARNGRVLRRMMWGTSWGEWYEMALKSDIPDVSNIPINTAYKGLGDFIACGDSNTVSLSYPTSSAGIPVKSWARSLAEMIGSECDIYAAGGRSTAGFISSADYAPAIADTKQFAILYLGINDCSQSVEIETFTANYTTIVNALLTNHKFVFCLNIPAAVQPSSRRTQYNTAIESVCSSIQKAFLVDITGCSDRIAVYKNVGHLSSIGYAVLAGEIAQAINKTMSENDYFDAQIDTDSAT